MNRIFGILPIIALLSTAVLAAGSEPIRLRPGSAPDDPVGIPAVGGHGYGARDQGNRVNKRPERAEEWLADSGFLAKSASN